MKYRPDWLRLVREDAIEPDLPIVDSHHHLWDDDRSIDFGRFLPEDYLADISESGHNIVATVYVEARSRFRTTGPEALRAAGEVAFADEAAESVPSDGPKLCAGIIAYADLATGSAVEEVLDAHAEASPRRFRGVRYQATWDRSVPPLRNRTEGMLRNPAVIEGAKVLERRGLVLDTHVFHPQIQDLIDFARALPDLTIVLDHIATPLAVGRYQGLADVAFQEWNDGMKRLASCENVRVKVGGLLLQWSNPGLGHGEKPPTSEELAAAASSYYRKTIELFSPARCMFESGFPVDRESVSMGVLWNAYKRMTSDFSPAERDSLFRGTAAEAYRLEGI